jgi:hypothetical protein
VLLETYIVGTIVAGWALEFYEAVATDNFVWILENDARLIRWWYSTSATYIFGIVKVNFSYLMIVVYQVGHRVVFVSVVQ